MEVINGSGVCMEKVPVRIGVDFEVLKKANDMKLNKTEICNTALREATLMHQTSILEGSTVGEVLDNARKQLDAEEEAKEELRKKLRKTSHEIAVFFRKNQKLARSLMLDIKNRGWSRETPEKNLKFWEEVLFEIQRHKEEFEEKEVSPAPLPDRKSVV